MSSSGECGWLWPKEPQLSLPAAQPCSPVLWAPVVQPAGPAGEAENGVEGALQAVQCPLWGQQGQCQGQDRDTTLAQHCPALASAQKRGKQLIPSPERHRVTSHNVVATATRAVSTSTLDHALGGKRNHSGIEVGPGKAKLLPSTAPAREGFHTNTSAPHLTLTYEIPGHLLVLLHAAHLAELQEGVHVVGVHLEQQLHRGIAKILSLPVAQEFGHWYHPAASCDTQCQELPSSHPARSIPKLEGHRELRLHHVQDGSPQWQPPLGSSLPAFPAEAFAHLHCPPPHLSQLLHFLKKQRTRCRHC